MSRIRSALAFLAGPAALLLALAAHPRTSPAAPVVGAYYAGYAADRYPVSRIPADRLTHLFYAFAHIEDGQCASAPASDMHFAEIAQLKRAHPHLRALISIGGWAADGFSDAALTPASRERFVASCLALFFTHPQQTFDGVDIDWEYPVSGGPPGVTARPEDRDNMTRLAQEFRRQLDALGAARGRTLLLTAALPAGRLQYGGAYDPADSFDLRALARTLDFINLMTYDMSPSALGVAGPNAPFGEDTAAPLPAGLRRANTVEAAVDHYLHHGVPARKLVLGVPFHGRGARVAPGSATGLHQRMLEPYEPGPWRVIRADLLGDPGWRRYWSGPAQSPWLYHPQQHLFVSYEDPRSVARRARLARDRGLRGVFAWELAGDDDAHSLLHAMTTPWR